MLNLMPKISEKIEQVGNVQSYIQKYGRVEIQYFPRKPEPHEIDFSKMVELVCKQYDMKEITIHLPLVNYEIEVVLMYDEGIIRNQLEQLVLLSDKLNIDINLIYHTHWNMVLHRANTINKIKELLKIIEGKRVKLLIENLFMMDEPRNECTALSLCKEVNHPNFKMCLDICHFHCQANMYREKIINWMDSKLNAKDCKEQVHQIHFAYTANNDGYKDKKTHGVGHQNKRELVKDFKLLERYGISNKIIVIEVQEKDYSNRVSQIKDIKWLESLSKDYPKTNLLTIKQKNR